MLRQPFSQVFGNLSNFDPVFAYDWNRWTDGFDLQLRAVLRYCCGDGVVAGGVIQAAKTVTPVQLIVGRGGQGTWYGETSANVSIAAKLTNAKENTVWASLIRVPATGPDSGPGYATTFNKGRVNFKVQDTAPPNSFMLGKITLDAGGVVTAIDNEPTERPSIYPVGSWRTWSGSVVVPNVPAGQQVWTEVDHSSELEFLVTGEVSWWNPLEGGIEVRMVESVLRGQIRFMVVHHADPSYPYYGRDAVHLFFSRTGVPVP